MRFLSASGDALFLYDKASETVKALRAWAWKERPRSLALCENQGVDTYSVVIHQDAEGGYWAEVPALPGCYSQGDSVPELMNNIREAIAGVLEVMKEQGTHPEANIQILEVAV
jgi:predicted RNase H-like HicB family nuclease